MNNNFEYEDLQFPEIKMQIAKCCSFSGGQNIILDTYPQFRRLPVQLALRRLKQALDLTYRYGSMPFGGVWDVRETVSLAAKGVTLTCEDLLRIADQCYAIKNIKNYIQSAEIQADDIKELTDTLQVFEQTANRINKCINRSLEVNDNASQKLASLRRQKKNLQASIATRLNQYLAKNASMLQDNIIAQRNGRSVVLIKNSFKNSVSGLQYGTSSSGAATYVEPNEIVGLNNDLQNTIEEENREVQRILGELSRDVGRDAYHYIANLDTLALLDSIFAKAIWARQTDSIVGELSENMDLIIEKGRHPLIDPSKVVANSYHLVSPIRTILITGPNTGGKTVSLKLIGLFVVMHLSGMALPCREARIPVYDNVFTDIGDKQSITDDLSTFSAHIRKLSSICSEATSRSLVILDELGSGTDPVEGEAIAGAVLDYFRRQEIFTIATTHYARLKAYGQQYDDILLTSVEFDRQQLKPTYRFLENSIGQSNALEIASRYGLKEEIVEKAREFKKDSQTPQDIALEKLQAELEAVEQKNTLLSGQIEENAKLKEDLQAAREKLEADRQGIISDARSQAYDIVSEAREEMEEIIEDLKSRKEYKINEVAQIKHRVSELLAEEEEETVIDEPVKVGDWAKITLTNQHGEVIAMDRKYATILCSGTKIKVSLGNIVKTTKPKPKPQANTTMRPKISSFKNELNMIGMHVEEGMLALDKFMDEALLARVPYVRIIHGMGSGILRKAVWDRLKTYKFVEKYEIADAKNGGGGATVVNLKGGK